MHFLIALIKLLICTDLHLKDSAVSRIFLWNSSIGGIPSLECREIGKYEASSLS